MPVARLRALRAVGWIFGLLAMAFTNLVACAKPTQPTRTAPCFVIRGDSELRTKDAKKTLDELAGRIRLSPEDEALKNPKSIDDIRTILRRDAVYIFDSAAAFARSLNTIEGRFGEAYLELLLGESQLI